MTVKVQKNEVDLTTGNLFKKILFVSLPLMLSGVLQLLYNAADLIICGKFGSEHSVAAISATSSLINLIVQLFLGLSVGGAVVMARCYGSQDQQKGSRVVHTAMFLSLIFGVVIGLFGIFFSHSFLKMMGTPNDVIHLSKIYLIIYFIGLPFSMIYNFGSCLLRATGDTKRPFYYLAFAGIANVILNLIFVLIFHLDVAGVAIATITAQGISAILVLRCLIKNTGFCKFSFSKLKIHKIEALEIMRFGIPAGLQGTIFALSNVIIQSSVNSLGTIVMDGNGASASLEGFVYTCMNAIAQTSVSFIGANYGAKNVKNIKLSVIYSTILVILFGLSLGSLVTIFGQNLLKLYIDNPAAIEIGYERLKIICLTYFTCGLMDVFSFALRGIGYSILPTIVSMCGACGLRILWVFTIFNNQMFHNLKWLSLSYPISWIITTFILIILYLSLKNKVFKQIEENQINASFKKEQVKNY